MRPAAAPGVKLPMLGREERAQQPEHARHASVRPVLDTRIFTSGWDEEEYGPVSTATTPAAPANLNRASSQWEEEGARQQEQEPGRYNGLALGGLRDLGAGLLPSAMLPPPPKEPPVVSRPSNPTHSIPWLPLGAAMDPRRSLASNGQGAPAAAGGGGKGLSGYDLVAWPAVASSLHRQQEPMRVPAPAAAALPAPAAAATPAAGKDDDHRLKLLERARQLLAAKKQRQSVEKFLEERQDMVAAGQIGNGTSTVAAAMAVEDAKHVQEHLPAAEDMNKDSAVPAAAAAAEEEEEGVPGSLQ